MRVRVVVVGVEGAVNLGFIARTCLNFGVERLVLVEPVASIEEALNYSAKARDYLLSADIVGSIREAVNGCDLVVATTGKGYSVGDYLRQAISLRDFIELLRERSVGEIAVLFGRESTGLTRRELEEADFLVTIPANPEYPILNLSQAVAIVLYELWLYRSSCVENIPPRADKSLLEEDIVLVKEIVSRLGLSSEKVYRINRVLERLLYRSMPSRYEARVLRYVLRRVLRRMSSG